MDIATDITRTLSSIKVVSIWSIEYNF